MFLKDDPQSTGKIFIAMVALRIPALSCLRWALSLKEEVKDLVVGVGNSFDQRMTGLFGLVEQLGGNLFNRILGAHRLVMPVDRLHRDQVDDTSKLGFGTDLNIDGNSARTQAIDNG